jgi:hypothetical protein
MSETFIQPQRGGAAMATAVPTGPQTPHEISLLEGVAHSQPGRTSLRPKSRLRPDGFRAEPGLLLALRLSTARCDDCYGRGRGFLQPDPGF